ncbi:Peroxiredoxin family protein [Sphingobium faniae]|nr:Peroxiredoxin family protein [Sphingobium faniae]
MRELRIIVASQDSERLRAALVTASAQAALGGKAAVFLQLDAVALLRAPIGARLDEAHEAAGLPTLALLLDDALALGVVILACQSGLALSGMSAADLPSGAEVSGPVAFLQQTGDDARILFA